MEEGDKDGTFKAEEKPSTVHAPTSKPRPIPRPRNQPKGATTTQSAGKPDKLPPKPVLLPKPRRPPPNAPSEKPASPNECVVTNNNDVAADKRPLNKPHSVTETNKNLPPSEESINNVDMTHTENGTADVNSMDNQWYEPLRTRTESASSSSDDGYEEMLTTDKNKDSQATVPRSVTDRNITDSLRSG